MSIKLLNTEQELKSFPITQKFTLECSSDIDLTDVVNTIFLVNTTRRDSLLNLSEPRNFNLALAKDTYGTVPIKIEKTTSGVGCTLTVSPLDPLSLSSSYILYIDKQLSEPFTEVVKTQSKSSSEVLVEPGTYLNPGNKVYTVKLLTTSSFTSTGHTVKIEVTSGSEITTKLLNLNKVNYIELKDSKLIFPSKAYVSGEEFSVTLYNRTVFLDESLAYEISTAGSSSITPLPLEQHSTTVSNQDVIDFYNSVTSFTPVTEVKYILTYLSTNSFQLVLNSVVTKSDIDISNMKISVSAAFNNYLLSSMGLYDPELKYTVKILWDEDENAIQFICSSDNLATDLVTIDTSEW
jgi:hypothetical protein